MELVGPYIGTVAAVCVALSGVALGWLSLWRWRLWRDSGGWGTHTTADAALTATLLAVVTSRVLSAQYLIWLLALAACCLSATRSPQRATSLLILAAAAL